MISDTFEIPQERRQKSSRLLRAMLWIFSGAIAFSLGGTLLVQLVPDIMSVFGKYFIGLVKAPTWTYMAMLPVIAWVMYVDQVGIGRMAAIAGWGILVGGASELIGTSTGLPFGEYAYTDWLGPKFLDHVPYFIPASWFAMSIVSFDLASRVSSVRLVRILMSATVMTLWDVSLDPAMSRAFPFWTYTVDGFFYGMPLSNWAGWILVSLVIAVGIDFILQRRSLRSNVAPLFYFLNCFFPFALSFLYGLYGASIAGVAATTAVLVISHRAEQPRAT